jgi:hypothetical protein
MGLTPNDKKTVPLGCLIAALAFVGLAVWMGAFLGPIGGSSTSPAQPAAEWHPEPAPGEAIGKGDDIRTNSARMAAIHYVCRIWGMYQNVEYLDSTAFDFGTHILFEVDIRLDGRHCYVMVTCFPTEEFGKWTTIFNECKEASWATPTANTSTPPRP